MVAIRASLSSSGALLKALVLVKATPSNEPSVVDPVSSTVTKITVTSNKEWKKLSMEPLSPNARPKSRVMLLTIMAIS